jgi:hypothetical protein
MESGIEGRTAPPALVGQRAPARNPTGIGDRTAAAAGDYRLTSFHGEKRDEEQTHVLIGALEPRRGESTGGADSGGVVHSPRLRLNSADEKEHPFSSREGRIARCL